MNMENVNLQKQPSKLEPIPHLKKPSIPSNRRTISAASVFKQRGPSKGPQNVHRTAAAASSHSGTAHQNAKIDAGNASKATSEQSDASKHPLAVAFNEATTEYRSTLYTNAISQINETHSTLTSALHNANTLPSPNQNLTRKEYLHNLIEGLYTPIGLTGLVISQPNTYGENENEQEHERHNVNEDEQVEIQLGQRISQLENQIDADEKSISMLQTQWERVVGEIWKCGVQILGKEEMGKFLVAGNAVDGQEKDEEGASLFVPEHGDAEQKRHQSKKGSKKRVKFGDPEKELPEFITHVRKGEGVPAAPEVPVREVREMEKRIESLGVKRIEELKRLNEEQDAWYRKKTQQLLTVWQADV